MLKVVGAGARWCLVGSAVLILSGAQPARSQNAALEAAKVADRRSDVERGKVRYASLLEKYGGSYRRFDFLDEPVVATAIVRLLGEQAKEFRESMTVTPPVDRVNVYTLFLSGIAEHRGGLQRAAISFDTDSGSFSIAIFLNGEVNIWTDKHSYEDLPGVLQDWLLDVANGNAHRWRPPAGMNVELHASPAASRPTGSPSVP